MRALLFSRLTPLLILKALPPEVLAADDDYHHHHSRGDVGCRGAGGGGGDYGGGAGVAGVCADGCLDSIDVHGDGCDGDDGGGDGDDDDDGGGGDDDDDLEEGIGECLEDVRSLLLERSSRVYEYDQVNPLSR